jgi:hypothetical protein
MDEIDLKKTSFLSTIGLTSYTEANNLEQTKAVQEEVSTKSTRRICSEILSICPFTVIAKKSSLKLMLETNLKNKQANNPEVYCKTPIPAISDEIYIRPHIIIFKHGKFLL